MKNSRILSLIGVLAVLLGGMFYLKNKQNAAPAEQAQTAPTEVKELYLLSWAEYFPEELLKAFETKFNAKIIYDSYANNEELLAKMESGNVKADIIVPSDYMVEELIKKNMLAELPAIANKVNIIEAKADAVFDPGLKHSIPYTWGATGLAVDTSKVKELPTSWADLLNPKYTKDAALIDDLRETLGIILAMKNKNFGNADEVAAREAGATIKKLLQQKIIFSADMRQILETKNKAIAHAYNGDVVAARKENPNWKLVFPKEGYSIWTDCLAIPKTAAHPELAAQFINFVLEPEMNRLIPTTMGFASAIKPELLNLPAEILNDTNIYVDLSHGFYLGNPTAQVLGLLEKEWVKGRN